MTHSSTEVEKDIAVPRHIGVCMRRLTAKDFSQELLGLYDAYAHGDMTKYEFLDLAQKYAHGSSTAEAILSSMSPNYALARQVASTDPDIRGKFITYPSPQGHGLVQGYFARPAKGEGRVSAVVVAHENRGLNPYIEDVARRVAKVGFIALAPDGLSSVGGYPGDDEKGRELQQGIDPEKLRNDFFAAIEYLEKNEYTDGKVAIVGFCYGGTIANAAATTFPRLAAAVAFYGRQPPLADIAKIKSPLLLHYAELDRRITEGWSAYEAALKAGSKTYDAYVYQGVNHGFHNGSTPRYDEQAAILAWDRTVTWLEKHLRPTDNG